MRTTASILTNPSFRRAFTLIELLVIIVIIGILAGLTVGVSGIASRRSKMSRTQAELARVELAIRDYKARFGFYPPDNVRDVNNLVTDPVLNQLAYELRGATFDRNALTYTALGDAATESILRADYRQWFGANNLGGIYNSSASAANVKNFLNSGRAPQVRTTQLAPTLFVRVLAVPVEWPVNHPLAATDSRFQAPLAGVPGGGPVNPWRYNSTNPTNNPGEFDLWADIVIGNEIVTIGNWKEE